MEPPPARTRRARVSVIGVIGELLITAGVFVFLFLGWQLWLNDIIVGNEQNTEAQEFSRELRGDAPAPTVAPKPSDAPTEPEDFGEPVVAAKPDSRAKFANLYIPRFGADYVRTIAEDAYSDSVLQTGIGHYDESQMPGEIGNFAVAAHRTTWGAPFNRIADLRVGDRIYVETADGWYTYVYRSSEYVRPRGIEVLEPVPQLPDAVPTQRLITLTSCNPMLSAAERIIAYGVYESWRPTSAGPPAEIAALVGAAA